MKTAFDDLSEKLSMAMYGRSISLARAGKQCVKCGKRADTFKDKISEAEYRISCFCQSCQDKTFDALKNEIAKLS